MGTKAKAKFFLDGVKAAKKSKVTTREDGRIILCLRGPNAVASRYIDGLLFKAHDLIRGLLFEADC